ncbi:hypothetical protein PsorP6_004819 [Peronosclerospora sorghi]|uniref:Uncharacterized protein n=1 Tax=Peronosclerospora sorghi TaxID=230839 RepID=A0ACC0VSG3_9STRA|nr:hypothetical protein PsorP6_004819 [Peronosclerospora sorghi]
MSTPILHTKYAAALPSPMKDAKTIQTFCPCSALLAAPRLVGFPRYMLHAIVMSCCIYGVEATRF